MLHKNKQKHFQTYYVHNPFGHVYYNLFDINLSQSFSSAFKVAAETYIEGI